MEEGDCVHCSKAIGRWGQFAPISQSILLSVEAGMAKSLREKR
jgi:hypothetical protein